MSKVAEEAIRKYIMIHPKCTKNDVVEYMNTLRDESRRLSRVSTLNSIDDLEDREIISVLKTKRKGQSHHLIINEENIVNLIDKWISEIKDAVTMVIKNLDTAKQLLEEYSSQNTHHPEELEKLVAFLKALFDILKSMIDLLLIKIYAEVKSSKDREILSARIVILLLKTLKYTLQPMPPFTVMEQLRYYLRGDIITEPIKAYARNNGMDIDDIYRLMPKIDKFEKQFLRH